jgi:CRISPR-associated protein Cas2
VRFVKLLVVYDVNTETKAGQRRLRKVAKVCEGYGQRVQKSVFECSLQPVRYEQLRGDLLDIIERKQDDLRIYRLADKAFEAVEHFGANRTVDFEKPLIV